MQLLRRNCTEFEYLPYLGVEEELIVDEDDPTAEPEHTGEFHPQYGNPVVYRGNISAPSGYTNQTFYGEDIRYTHTLVMDKLDANINEHGLIRWKDELYDIQAVRPSLNGASIALKKQTTDGAADE